MQTILLSAVALGALTTAVTAEPMTLTDGQMDKVTAGAAPGFYVAGIVRPYLSSSGDAAKVRYYTPSSGGDQVGASLYKPATVSLAAPPGGVR